MTDEELIVRLREGFPWMKEAADRIEALVKDAKAQESEIANLGENLDAQKRRAERLEATVIAAAKIGQIVGSLGEDEGLIEAFREACGPELWAKAREALKGDDHE